MEVKAPRRRATRIVATGLLACASPAWAGAPTQADICDQATNKVVPERLALAVLESEGVSPFPYRWITTHKSDYPGLTPAQHILSQENFCGPNPKDSLGIPRCGKEDAAKIGRALNLVMAVLTTPSSYLPSSPVIDPPTYFQSTGITIACVKKPDGKPVELEPTQIASPVDQKTIPLRIRGSTDGLQFDRNLDSAFAGVEKASFSFKDDDVAGKKTTKASIIVGLSVPVVDNVLGIVPYLGVSLDNSKKTGQQREVSDDTWRAGTLFDFRTHQAQLSHLFLLRPEYAANRKEKSEVVSANFTYIPVFNGWLNDARNVTSTNDESLFSIIPRFDLRLNGGHFIKQGSRLDEDSQDFIRLGGQVGATLTSDVKWLPLELTLTETYLRALDGGPKNLSQFKGIFSIYFDEKKFFGIDLGYARGRREDLAKRERNWTFGFGAKF